MAHTEDIDLRSRGISSSWVPMLAVLLITVVAFSLLLLKLPDKTSKYSSYRRIANPPRDLFGLFTTRAAAAADFVANGPRQVREAYAVDKTTPYYIASADRLVLPPDTLAELSRLPADVANLRENFNDRYAGKWTGFDVILETSLFSDVVRSGLTNNLDALTPHLRAALQQGLATHLAQHSPNSHIPITVPLFPALLDATLAMTALTLVGRPLCNDEAFLRILKAYPSAIDAVAKQFANWPPTLHPVLAVFSKPLRRLRAMQSEMEAVLKPVVEERRRTAREELRGSKDPFNVLTALCERATGPTSTPRKIGLQLMFLSLAALFVTAVSATQVVLQLVERKEWVGVLRAEAEGIRGDRFGSAEVKRMLKLDAFVKETLRINMPGWSSVMRKSLRPFRLTTHSIHVPAHAMVCLPTAAMSRDPFYFQDADAFDPPRFYAAASSPAARDGPVPAQTTSRLSDLDPAMPIWGLGRWSCPGRFYADLQIKLIAMEVLIGWDVALPEGARGEGIRRINTGDRIIPDPKQEVVFARRTGEAGGREAE